MMKNWLVGTLVVALVTTMTPGLSEAKRLGGGMSQGMQRSLPARNTPQTPPAQPATPPAATPNPGAAATAGAAAPAAAAAKRSWMGPIAGLAAGLGIAALLSHFGLGEGMANMLMMVLLAVAAFAAIRFLMRRFGGAAQRAPLAAAAPAGGPPSWMPAPTRREPAPEQVAVARVQPQAGGADVSVTGAPLAPRGAPPAPAPAPAPALALAPAGAARSGPALPEGFDLPAFERIAKMIFIRLQAANDAADLDDLRQFTTPELFAALRLELQERAGKPQQTDVERVDADVIDYAAEDSRQLVSVRFHGLVREEQGAAATAFDEVWHLVKPADDSRSWSIAGIQQPQ